MRTVNKVILIGNITKDPLIKTTEWDKKIALFSLATNRYYKTLTWENKSEAEFHNCVAWWSLAETVEKFVTKWKLVYIEGRLKTRILEKEWEPRNYKTEVVVSNLIFLNKKSDFETEGDFEEHHDEIEDDRF